MAAIVARFGGHACGDCSVIAGGDCEVSDYLFVCAGDISADLHAARLIRTLKKENPNLKYFGIGGPALAAEGVEILHHIATLGVIGIVQVLKHLPHLTRVRSQLIEEIKRRKPKALLLVDYGAFNLSLAAKVKAINKDMPVIYFISPQVWGSRPWRINEIAAHVNKMLVIFPFEEALYRRRGIDAHFVGHPLLEKLAEESAGLDKEAFCQRFELDPQKPIVAIFPGSRKSEIGNFMGFLLQSVNWIRSRKPDVQFVLSEANQFIRDEIHEQLFRHKMTHLAGKELKLVPASENYPLMDAADLIWAKSGTTSLEAALMEKSMLVFYRADWLSFVMFLLFKQVKYVAWPNLFAGEMLVPELIQLDCRAEKFVQYTLDWLDVPGIRADISSRLKQIKEKLGKGDFAANAALEVQKTLDQISAS